MKPTKRELAKRIGTTVGWVTRALTGYKSARAVRARLAGVVTMEEARGLGLSAKDMAAGRTHVLAAIFPPLRNSAKRKRWEKLQEILASGQAPGTQKSRVQR